MKKQVRIETLDWLRGLMALSIMFYHLRNWIYDGFLDSQTIFGRLGIYGVSIFFILSGLSMAIVYNKYIDSFSSVIKFFVRRIFRIWPLLWVVSLLILLPSIIKTGQVDWKLLFLNLTTLFGFIDPTACIATVFWSIGNEMVYYAFTPFIFILYNFRKWMGNTFLLLCFSIGMAFAFRFLDPTLTLAEQWACYVNPFNNLFLYVIGIGIYYNFKDFKIKDNYNNIILLTAVLLFCFSPFYGNQIVIVTAWGRVYFVLLSTLIVLCFYKMQINLPKPIAYGLEKLGIATYGVYLLHPVVYSLLTFIFKKTNITSQLSLYILVSCLTIVVALLSYNLFELKFIKLGKQLLSSKDNKKA